MSRKGENIYKRKDGRWEGRYIKCHDSTGKASYGYVYARSYRDLKLKLNDIRANTTKYGIYNTNSSYSMLTFKKVSQEWLKYKYVNIKESTYMRYTYLLNNYIYNVIGNYDISLINDKHLENLSRMLLAEGGKGKQGLSPKTVTDILSLVKSILRFSVYRRYSSVYTGNFITIKQNMKEMRVLSRKEQQLLTMNIIHSNNLKDIGILICLYTGIRIGELCALRWEDISISEKVLTIHNTLQRIKSSEIDSDKKTKIILSSPKSKCSHRTIPIPDELIDILIHIQADSRAYVLTGIPDKFVEPRSMQNHFKKTIKKCSINDANFHCLRHSFATRCVEVGFDIKSLSEILGHANVNITMNRYIHPTMELKRQNMNRLSDLLAVK
ncbi:site-specific integrase [Roseburia hominis]